MKELLARALPLLLLAFPPALALAWLVERLVGGPGLVAFAALAFAGLGVAVRLRRAGAAGERAAVIRAADLRYDSTTGLLVRQVFMEELGSALRRVRAAPQRACLSLVLIDLDHLKALNDSLGHKAGDQALLALADRVRAVFPRVCVGRLGGDEFAVIGEGATPAEAERLAATLLEALLEPAVLGAHQVRIGASIGIASAPLHSSFAEDLLALADLALYESKRAGRGRATVFDEAFLQEERHRRFIERELRAAVLLDHLDVHYQPLVDAASRCVGVEALLRWNHPSLGSISPAEFVAVAERSTLIDRVGEWVLRRVCRDLPRLPGASVSFNVSGAQLRRPEFLTTLARVISETGAEPRRLVAEITENVALDASSTVTGNIEALRGMGIRVALDDFGTGHCSFQTLRALSVDAIKLDRSYVSTMASDPVSQIFVSAVCETARLLGLPIVAEGVENETELTLARAAGCAVFQGYHFRRPAPLAELEEWLGRRGGGEELAARP